VIDKRFVKVKVSSSSEDGQHLPEYALEKSDNFWLSRLGDLQAHYSIDFGVSRTISKIKIDWKYIPKCIEIQLLRGPDDYETIRKECLD
jgi:hypothetical protein